MTQTQHCRHCLGDCQGTCLQGGAPGRCIHGWNQRPPRQFKPRYLLSRRWWHNVFWGVR
jgi:hypothetical protein